MNCINHPDRPRIAFCQNCGKPLCQECARTVGSAVFCEPCLAARLAGTTAPGSNAGTNPGAGLPPYAPPYSTVDASGSPVGVPGASGPSPLLATILGLLPGVGAMYNGQYAKGVVHLVVFAILVSLANENGIFGLFIAGWVVYQAIEANHTARARLAGTPLPNPFGLNDLGDRLGFGKNWPAAAPNVPPASEPAAASYVPPPYTPYTPYTAPVSGWGTPTQPPFAGSPAAPPYPATPVAPFPAAPTSRFPIGAVWLIVLGVLFLIGNIGMFRGFPVHRLVPFLLIGLGAWVFVHRMTSSGMGMTDDGSAQYRYRLFCALRGSIWIVLVGLLFLLDSFGILSWGRSWPLFIIVAGLMAFFHRTVYSGAGIGYPGPPVYPVPPAAPAAAVPSSHISGDVTSEDGERN